MTVCGAAGRAMARRRRRRGGVVVDERAVGISGDEQVVNRAQAQEVPVPV